MYTAGQQLTCEAGEVFLQVRGLDFVSQDVSLVEEQDNGGVLEPGRVDGGVEQCQTLVHTVLQRQTESETRLVVVVGESYTSKISSFMRTSLQW